MVDTTGKNVSDDRFNRKSTDIGRVLWAHATVKVNETGKLSDSSDCFFRRTA